MKRKQIELRFGDKTYTLEYNRESVCLMEQDGFDASKMKEAPATAMYKLFAGAFKANHKKIKNEEVDDILVNIKDKTGLYNRLIEMFEYTMSTLFTDRDDGTEGNATWETNW